MNVLRIAGHREVSGIFSFINFRSGVVVVQMQSRICWNKIIN